MVTLRQAAAAALRKLEKARVTIDSEWGHCRELEEIEADGDQWQEVIALRAALAEQQEGGVCARCGGLVFDPVIPQKQQEPYAWMAVGGTIWRHKTTEDDVPLYTTPQPRREVELTDEEIEEINVSLAGRRDLARMFARAVIAAYKAKQEKT